METKDDDHEPSSDVGSSEKRIDDSVSQEDENATKETPVSSSSSLSEARTTNQDSIKETKGEEAEASDDDTDEEVKKKKKRKLNDESSIFSDILADIKENPKILEIENKKNNITCRWFEDATPLDLSPAVLRQLEFKSNLIDILSTELESLKGRKQEAIKLGVDLSYLVAECTYLATDSLLELTNKRLQKHLKIANGPLEINGIVVYNLTVIFKYTKNILPLVRPRIYFTEADQLERFFKLFSDAIILLEDVICSIRDLSLIHILEEETERLSALDLKIEDCNRQLRKIEVAITEAKLSCLNAISEFSTLNLEESFFMLWNSLFRSKRKRKREVTPDSGFKEFHTDSESESQSSSQ